MRRQCRQGGKLNEHGHYTVNWIWNSARQCISSSTCNTEELYPWIHVVAAWHIRHIGHIIVRRDLGLHKRDIELCELFTELMSIRKNDRVVRQNGRERGKVEGQRTKQFFFQDKVMEKKGWQTDRGNQNKQTSNRLTGGERERERERETETEREREQERGKEGEKDNERAIT